MIAASQSSLLVEYLILSFCFGHCDWSFGNRASGDRSKLMIVLKCPSFNELPRKIVQRMGSTHQVSLTLLSVLMVFAMSIPSVAQNWIKDEKSGCKVQALYSGEGVTVLWSGSCKGGVANGKGKLTWLLNGEPGVVDTGNFLDGALEGKGSRNHIIGKWVYKGQFHGGKSEGKGRVSQDDGTVYDGDWESGTHHGKGHFKFANGNVYDGEVVKGKKSGHGRMTYSDGTYFEGQFIDDYAEGDGICKKDSHTGPCVFAHGTFVKWN